MRSSRNWPCCKTNRILYGAKSKRLTGRSAKPVKHSICGATCWSCSATFAAAKKTSLTSTASLDIAELEGEIADAESALEIWRAERESWYAKEKIHGEKAVHLAQELENMLQGK